MKRVWWLVPVPLAAALIAVLAHHETEAPNDGVPPAAAERAATSPAPAWVSTAGVRVSRAIHPAAEVMGHARAPKPPTEARTALLESRVPIVAGLSIDRPSSPREALLAVRRAPSEARQAQLDRLSDRTRNAITRLEAARAQATGGERAGIDRALKSLKKNQSYRDHVVATTVRSGMRPGAAADAPAVSGALPVP